MNIDNMKRHSRDEESESPDSKRKKKVKTSEVHSGNMCVTSDTCYVTRELAQNLKNASKKTMLDVLHMSDIVNSLEQSGLKEEFITNTTRLSQLFLKNGQNLVEGYDTNLGCLITFAYKLLKILKDVSQHWTALSSYIKLNQYLKFLQLINCGREQLCFILKNLNKKVLFKKTSEPMTEESESSIVNEAKPSSSTKTQIIDQSSSFKQAQKRPYSKKKIDSSSEKQRKKRKKNSVVLKTTCIKDKYDSTAEKQRKKRKTNSKKRKRICNSDVKTASNETKKKNKKKKIEGTNKFLSTETSSIRDNSSYTTREQVQNLKTSLKKLTLVILSMIETLNCLDESRFKEEFISNKNVMTALFLLNSHNLEEQSDTDLSSLINAGHEIIKIVTLVKDKWMDLARYLPIDQYLKFLHMINMEKNELNSILENMNKKFSSERNQMPKEVVNIQNNATKLDIMHPSLNSKKKDDADMGEKKKTNIYPMKVPDCIIDSKPHLQHDCCLHVFQMNLIEPLPMEMNPFNYPIKNPADSEIDVGILLSKSLPKINPYPIFSKIGKIRIDIFTEEERVNLSENELNLVKEFHAFICSDIYDVAMELIPEMPFYIVPVKKGAATVCIDFNCIKDSLLNPYHGKNSTDKKTNQPEISCEDVVFVKNYKKEQKKKNQKRTFHHFVRQTEICATSICSIPGYNSYEDYYNHTYKIQLKYKTKKLIETFSNTIFASHKAMYTSLNDKFVNSRNSSMGVEMFNNYREYLVPELCTIHPVKSSLLQKFQCIPVILYRMYSLLVAEELRSLIFGFINIEKEYKWSFFDINKTDKNVTDIFSNVSCSSQNYNNPPSCDIIKNKQNFLSFCKTSENHFGPSPGNILEAITLAKANDAFDLERYEIIGDAFLKYVITFKLFLEHQNYHSKRLSIIREDLIKNQHLYDKACEKQIPSYLIINEFQEKTTIPKCFIQNLNDQTEKNRTMNLKKIADSVESLIGSCLINSGQSAAIIFMQYVSLEPIPKNIDISKNIIYKWPAIITKISEAKQKTIEEFNNQNLMSKALRKIQSIDNIKLNRMSYLGNAIIGYLITRFIYEDDRNLSPSEITLLRNNLVNNNLFASLTLKYKLAKHIKSMQCESMKQKEAGFCNSEYFRYIQAKGYPSEDLEFPEDYRGIVRKLSDVFQGLAAIVYMDNDCSVDAVWCEYYKMLQGALEFYMANLPLSTKKDLEQVLKTTEAFTQIYHGGDNWHVLLLLPNGTVINTTAPQLKIAKKMAAKKFLEKMKNQKDLI